LLNTVWRSDFICCFFERSCLGYKISTFCKQRYDFSIYLIDILAYFID